MPKIYKGSPSFKLFWTDAAPILSKAVADAAKAGTAVLVAALSSEQLRAVIAQHFGALAAAGFGSLLALALAGRWLTDNTKV
jgi:hypothetical protein